MQGDLLKSIYKKGRIANVCHCRLYEAVQNPSSCFDALSKQVVRWTSAIICRMKFDTQANDAWISFYTEQDKLTLKSIPTVQLELLKLAEVPY